MAYKFRFAIVSDLHIALPHTIWQHPLRHLRPVRELGLAGPAGGVHRSRLGRTHTAALITTGRGNEAPRCPRPVFNTISCQSVSSRQN